MSFDEHEDASDGFAEFLRSMMPGGMGEPKPSDMVEMAKQMKAQLNEKLLNETVESMDVDELVKILSSTKCEMDLSAPVFLSPGDILVRLTNDEIELANLPPFPYRFPRPGQPIEVIKIISDPLPNSSGSVEDFIAKVNLYTIDCESCPHHGQDHDDDTKCRIKVRDTMAYTMNSRYFKFYHK